MIHTLLHFVFGKQSRTQKKTLRGRLWSKKKKNAAVVGSSFTLCPSTAVKYTHDYFFTHFLSFVSTADVVTDAANGWQSNQEVTKSMHQGRGSAKLNQFWSKGCTMLFLDLTVWPFVPEGSIQNKCTCFLHWSHGYRPLQLIFAFEADYCAAVTITKHTHTHTNVSCLYLKHYSYGST